MLWLTYFKFSFACGARGGKPAKALAGEEEIAPLTAQALPISHPVFSVRSSIWQFLSLTRIQFTETVRNVFFIVLMLAGGLFAMFVANGINNPFSTHVYPVTYQMLELATGGFFIFALAIITFYSGELVWREREAGVSQIVDALPVQRWVLFASKLCALLLIQVLIVMVTMAAGLLVQILHGYYRFQLGLYFRDLFGIRLVQYCILCVLALLVHTIINNKYLGHFVMVLYFVATIAIPNLGLQNYLYRFGQTPPYIYSDMNLYGPFAAPLFWYQLYWAIFAVGLAIVTNLLWLRSTEGSFGTRLHLAAERLSRPAIGGLAVCLVLFLGVGSYIFYNTGHSEYLSHELAGCRRPCAIRKEVPAIQRSASSPHHRHENEHRPGSGKKCCDAGHYDAGEQDFREHRPGRGDRLAVWTWRRCRGSTYRSTGCNSRADKPQFCRTTASAFTSISCLLRCRLTAASLLTSP